MFIEYFVSIGPLPSTDPSDTDDWFDSHGPFASLDDAQDYAQSVTWTYVIDEYTRNDDGSLVGIREISQ